MLNKRHKRVPYPSLKTILPLPLLRTRNIRMYRNPCTRKNRDNAAPNNIPYAATMGKVAAWIRLEWTTGDRRNRVGADREGQVVEKYEEKHFERWVKKDLLTGYLLSEWATKRLRGAEYTCGRQWADLGPIDIIIVRAEAMKQVGFPVRWHLLPPNDSVSGEIGIYLRHRGFLGVKCLSLPSWTSR